MSSSFSRLGTFLAAGTVLVSVAIVPLLVDPANSLDPYYGLKAWALWLLIPALVTALSLAGWDDGVRRQVQWKSLLAFVLAMVAATVLGVDPSWSLLGAPWRHEGALTLLAYALICAGTTAAFGRGRTGIWLAAVQIGATAVALGGVVQVLGWDWLPRDIQRAAWHQAFSTTGNPNWLGAYMVLAAPLAAAGVQRARSLAARMVGLAGFGLVVLAALMTLSRVTWVTLTLTLAIFGWLARSQRGPVSSGFALAGAVAAFALAAFLIPSGVRETAWGRVQEVARHQTGPVQERLYLWNETGRLLVRRPILGYGPEALPRVFPQAWTADKRRLFGDEPMVIDKAHNDTLDLAMSAGIAGVAAFWWVILASTRRAWRAARSPGLHQPVAAACVAATVGYALHLQFNFSVVSVAPVFWSLLGMSATFEPEGDRPQEGAVTSGALGPSATEMVGADQGSGERLGSEQWGPAPRQTQRRGHPVRTQQTQGPGYIARLRETWECSPARRPGPSPLLPRALQRPGRLRFERADPRW